MFYVRLISWRVAHLASMRLVHDRTPDREQEIVPSPRSERPNWVL